MSMTQSIDIENQLKTIINQNPHLQQNRFHFDARVGRVTVQGKVKSWYEKQMAQEVLRSIEGVVEIDNELTVEAV